MASGEMRGRYIRVESEHSALSACYGAAACGARAFTATSSQGLLYMNEMVFWTGLGRIPMVMAVVNRRWHRRGASGRAHRPARAARRRLDLDDLRERAGGI
jgi:pyruvate/2-oxoacid:ferredoxin oxidoreductase alpha subunit